MNQNILHRNNVKITGTGPQTILLAPGFGCDQSVWNVVTEILEEDYKVILFDYVGSGNSDLSAYDPEKYKNLTGYAQDVLDICSTLDLKETIFVGHSVSSMIGMLASLSHPEYFSHLIMLGPSPCYLNDPPSYFGGFEKEDLLGLIDIMEKNYIGWANMFAATVINDSNRLELQQDMEDRFCSTDPIIARQFAEATFFSDYREYLQKGTVPTLILQCTEDIIAPTAVGEYMHRQLPNSVLKMIDTKGHCPHMSHPKETVELILQYLKENIVASMQNEKGAII